jgi:N-acetylglucosamine-6-phosphate deacetylase
MTASRLRARHYATGLPIELVCERGQIASVSACADGGGPLHWVAPALFDLQINGCEGRGFSSERLTGDDVRHVVSVCRRHGIAGLCPTLVTNSFEALRHGLETIRRTCETDATVARAVAGIHLEGPHISPEDGPRGAHPKQHVRPPDWDEFCRLQEVSGGRVRLVTLAPEHDGALPFIEKLTAAGVVVAIGHTAATGDRIRDAASAGARLSTHLGNGAHAILPRHPNYIWDQLAEDRLWASIISDGHHLPASVVKSIVRIKTPARTILTCDASNLAGSPPGRYREWGQELEVLPGGQVVLSGTSYLAGSGVFTDVCVAMVMRMAGVSLAEAFDTAGARPRELLGLPPGRLEPGEPAELVVFETDADGLPQRLRLH